MQMDINPDWITFVLYDQNPDGSVRGGRVMGTGGPGGLYLSPYARDFFVDADQACGRGGRWRAHRQRPVAGDARRFAIKKSSPRTGAECERE